MHLSRDEGMTRRGRIWNDNDLPEVRAAFGDNYPLPRELKANLLRVNANIPPG